MIGWLMMGFGLIALTCLLLTSGDIWDRVAGSGGRRVGRRARLAQQRDEIANLKQRIAACPTCTPPELGFPTAEELAESDRSDPAPVFHQAAPIEQGCRDTPASNADTQPVDVSALRDATGNGDTQLLPVVPVTPVPPVLDEPLPPVTWPSDKTALEAWATATAPSASPTEVSMTAGLAAATSVKVQLATVSGESNG